MNPIAPDQLLGQLRWRYATKQFDPGRKIPDDIWASLEETLILTPSSYGLQPWKFLVVTDQSVKDSLVEHSWGQRQVADCSHLLVIAGKQEVSVEDVDQLVDAIEEIQGRARDTLEGYRGAMIKDIVEGPRSHDATGWAKLQCYIALGNFMTAAALLGVDACPMEGFKAAEYDKILGLGKKGLTTAVLCPAGYRSDDDKYGKLPKVRYGADELIERIG